jgi:hypothetical protein
VPCGQPQHSGGQDGEPGGQPDESGRGDAALAEPADHAPGDPAHRQEYCGIGQEGRRGVERGPAEDALAVQGDEEAGGRGGRGGQGDDGQTGEPAAVGQERGREQGIGVVALDGDEGGQQRGAGQDRRGDREGQPRVAAGDDQAVAE